MGLEEELIESFETDHELLRDFVRQQYNPWDNISDKPLLSEDDVKIVAWWLGYSTKHTYYLKRNIGGRYPRHNIIAASILIEEDEKTFHEQLANLSIKLDFEASLSIEEFDKKVQILAQQRSDYGTICGVLGHDLNEKTELDADQMLNDFMDFLVKSDISLEKQGVYIERTTEVIYEIDMEKRKEENGVREDYKLHTEKISKKGSDDSIKKKLVDRIENMLELDDLKKRLGNRMYLFIREAVLKNFGGPDSWFNRYLETNKWIKGMTEKAEKNRSYDRAEVLYQCGKALLVIRMAQNHPEYKENPFIQGLNRRLMGVTESRVHEVMFSLLRYQCEDQPLEGLDMVYREIKEEYEEQPLTDVEKKEAETQFDDYYSGTRKFDYKFKRYADATMLAVVVDLFILGEIKESPGEFYSKAVEEVYEPLKEGKVENFKALNKNPAQLYVLAKGIEALLVAYETYGEK